MRRSRRTGMGIIGRFRRLGQCQAVSCRLRTAAGLVLLFPVPVLGGTIYLTDETAPSYIERGEDGLDRLKPASDEENNTPDEIKRCYAAQGFLPLGGLTLDSAGTELLIDSGGNAASLTVSDYLRLEKGLLHITAASPDAETAALTFTGSAADGHSVFSQTGGEALIESEGDSIGIDGGNAYKIQGGAFTARTRGKSMGLRLIYSDINTGEHDGSEVFFGQTGGNVLFEASDASLGLNASQSAEISGGALNIVTEDEAQGIALMGADTEFRQTGGAVSIKSSGNSTGLSAPKLHMDGGRLYLESGGHADAVRLGSVPSPFDDEGVESAHGLLLLTGGTMQVARNEVNPSGYAVYGSAGSRAYFGASSLLQPVLDADSKGAPMTGLISVGGVTIEPQAKLDVMVRNAARIKAETPLSLTFLESREMPIEGRFTAMPGAAGEKLFYRYETAVSADGKSYQIILTPKHKDEPIPPAPPSDSGDIVPSGKGGGSPAPDMPQPVPTPDDHPALRVSDIMRGNNRRAAQALEAALRAMPADAAAQSGSYQAARNFYDSLYNSGRGAERQITERMRALSPYQATRLPAVTLGAQSRFGQELRSAAGRADKNSAGGFWLTPVGAHGQYSAESGSFGRLSYDEGGMSFGVSAAGGKASYALGGDVRFGHMSGTDAYRADMRHLFLGGAFTYALPANRTLDVNAAYGNSRYKQHRRDGFDADNNSAINQNSFMASAAAMQHYDLPAAGLRFVPQAGLDYAYIRQDKFREHGGALPFAVSGADFNALRLKAGGEVAWSPADKLSFTPYAYYLYDALDRNVSFNAQLRELPSAVWRVKGERTPRSAANAGARLRWQAKKNLELSALWDITARPNRVEQQLSARIKLSF